MSAPILTTKLYFAPHRANVVFRTRLVERLNQGLHHKLILISAPAGFGKTTLVSEWLAEGKRPAAWLSLDEGDSDPTRFLTYFVVGLQKLAANFGADILDALQSPQPPLTESLLTALLNETVSIPNDFVFVLDDYHLVDSKQIDGMLAFLIEQMPPQMHLVITTRQDPNLPLAQLRARNQLTELRAHDLRFTTPEASEFFNRTMGLNVSPQDVATLESRTEGWIAGLQLAATSMQGHPDSAEFVKSFRGSHRFVMDYLVEQVLQRQPENIQAFLLQTSILERLCAPLCAAVLLDSSVAAQATLQYLERANLFILPLDHERRWYRYHALFAELLRNRKSAYPSIELHQRASDWYARNDFPYEAITHALAIQDWTRAAEVIEQYSDKLPMLGESATRLGWLESFPPPVMLERPKLGLVYAWALYMSNQFDRAEAQLHQLTPFVQTIPSLLGEHFVIRLMLASSRYDMPAVIELARQALMVVPPEEVSPRSRILLCAGVAYDEMGGADAAAKNSFREAFELSKAFPYHSMVGNAPLPLTALAYLSEIEWREGKLRDAFRMYEQAVELAERWNAQNSLALCFAQWGRACLLYEWNDLDAAARALQESIRVRELWKNPRLLVPGYGLLALVMQARGQTDTATTLLDRAEQNARAPHSTPPDLGLLALYQFPVWLAQNNFQAIAQWEQQHASKMQSPSGRTRDTLPIVRARAWLARYYLYREDAALKQARALVEPALAQAQASGLGFDTQRLLLLDALTKYAQKDTTSAIRILKRALTLAEPENYVRSFLDLGKPMQDLLLSGLASESLREPPLRMYVNQLLSHFAQAFSIQPSQSDENTLIEPLTERELQVLELVAQGLSNREISERLVLALDTVKGHNRRIFDKLQVSSRSQVIVRARALGLI